MSIGTVHGHRALFTWTSPPSVAACRSQRRRNRVPFHRTRLQTNPKRAGTYRDPRVALQTGQSLALWHADVERVKQRRKEQEEFHPGQDFPEAHSSTDAERQEVLGLRDFAFRVDEARWVELFGLFPKVRVHVNGVKQRYHLDVLGQQETVQFKVAVNKIQLLEYFKEIRYSIV